MLFVNLTFAVTDGVNFEIKASYCNLENEIDYNAMFMIENFFKLENSDDFFTNLTFKLPCPAFNSQNLKIRMLSREYIIVIGKEELIFEGNSEEFEDVPANDIVNWWRENIGYWPDVVVTGELVQDENHQFWLEFETIPRDFLSQIEFLGLNFNPDESTYYVEAEVDEIIPFKKLGSSEGFNAAELFIHGSTEMI